MFKNTVARLASNWRPGIRVYLILMNLLLLCLLFPTISIFLFGEISSFRDAQLESSIENLRQGLEKRSVSLARSLSLSAEQAIAGYDYTFLNHLMAQVVGQDPEMLYALVMDGKGQVMAHNQVDLMGTKVQDDLAKLAMATLGKFLVAASTGKNSRGSFDFVEGKLSKDGSPVVPVLEIVMPVHSGKEMLGVMRCGFSLEGLSSTINHVRLDWAEKMNRLKLFFMSITAIFFLLGVLVAAFFNRLFLRSTTLLSEGVQQIADGDLQYVIPSRQMFCREFEHFATGFNEMTLQLRTSLNQLDEYSRSLEKKVEERTRELKEAQNELLQQAHEAGMAEMAVGVLHNIGNAITPAKVDAALLVRRLRDSPVRTGLASTSEKIALALQNPGKFIAPERDRLVEISTLLPISIREEYDLAIEGLERICGRHEHIEGIVGLQMRYAKLIGEHEEIDLNMVVEDALQMLGESIHQRKIVVEKRLGVIPLIKIEQAKMIQIVVNLIKNGYEAMDTAELPERRLTLTTFVDQDEPPYVSLSVKDTGIGFSDSEKGKMFKFGYSTKQTGSGFGLHSCANFMIANQGSLSAESPGAGKGAEFVVRFPALEKTGE